MHPLAKVSCVCAVLLSVLTLKGCADEASAPPNTPSCTLSGVIASNQTSGGNQLSVTWQKSYPYDDPSDVVSVCNTCCQSIKDILQVHQTYTQLCAMNGTNSTTSSLYQTCQSGCPSIELPPPNIQTLCQPCAAGSWSTSGRGYCTQCSAGRYIGQSGATSCKPCPYGRFSTTVGAASSSVCLDCAAGRSSQEGAAACQDCSAGTWRSSGMGLCESCSAGKWSSAIAAVSLGTCQNCGQGRWSNISAATSSSSCYGCVPGRWSASVGATAVETCIACVAGKYSATVAAISVGTCQDCPVGKTSTQVGASSSYVCDHCSRGRWSGSTGLTSNCTFCDTGRYNDQVGSSSVAACKGCVPGTYGPNEGMSQCVDCAPGNYSGSAEIICKQCNPGKYQKQQAATSCDSCPGGTYSMEVSRTTNCDICLRGSYSLVDATACIPCEAGKYGNSSGVTECITCQAGSDTPAGAHNCCPISGTGWPKEEQTLSIAPGKYYTHIKFVPVCETGTKPASLIDIRTDQTTPQFASSSHNVVNQMAVATLKQSKIHDCMMASCEVNLTCAVIPDGDEFIMPGRAVAIAAFVRTYSSGASNTSCDQMIGQHGCHKKCPLTVNIGFVGFGCEKGTIMYFLLGLVGVICATMIFGLVFEQVFRSRENTFVETSMRVAPAEAGKTGSKLATLPTLPTLIDLHYDVQNALTNNAPPASEWKLGKLGGWKVMGNSKDAVAVQVDTKTLCPSKEEVDPLRKFFQESAWAVGPAWKVNDMSVEVQPPFVVREAAKLPGADLMEAAESCAAKCLSCGMSREIQPHARAELHAKMARHILKTLMNSWAAKVIITQTVCNLVMIVLLPAIAFHFMTCADGFPVYIHGIWGLYLLITSSLSTYLLLREALNHWTTKAFFSMYRVRIMFRYFAMFISVSDLYQDATFPVISGRCGFDLWWVSLWLVFLGVGVMQVLVQLILLYKLKQRYKKANTAEERERIHIEGLFMALRASDNHVIVHCVKPAVEEHLGGGSSWTMKLMEARVAFLRFVFEDAEQTALQASFLLFFDQATTFDKVWVGFSTGTSLLLSFTLTVQTLPEVRDWIWFQFLSAFPYASQWAEARYAWLLVLVVFYRALSLFPWLGSCTPAGDHDDSTIRRLSFFFSEKSVPGPIKEEASQGSLIAFFVACVMIAIFSWIWRRQLCLPQRIFLRLCCSRAKVQIDPAMAAVLPMHDFGSRSAKLDSMAVEMVQDRDTWLQHLRMLYHIAKDAKADNEVDLLARLDDNVFHLVHVICLIDMPNFAVVRGDVDGDIKQLETAPLPVDSAQAWPDRPIKTTADLIKTMKAAVTDSLDVARVRGEVLSCLKDRTFQQASLDQKAQMISHVTGAKAPLRLLHWSVLQKLQKLPKFGEGVGAEDVPTILAKHAEREVVVVYFSHIWAKPECPDTADDDKATTLVRFAQWFQLRAKSHNMNTEVYFWIDYSCMDPGLDESVQAIPLYIAASSQILAWRTSDYDRRSWPMAERLLAYTFCPGGLTPFAVNASSFQVKLKEGTKKDEPAMVAVDVDSDSGDDDDGSKKKPPPAKITAKVVPVASAEEVGLENVRINYIPKKLPNPVDEVACRPTLKSAAAVVIQRRQVQQLVNVAHAVPALEVFADRQPVDFGLTEVVEQFLGPFKRLKPGDVPSGVNEEWLKVTFDKAAPAKGGVGFAGVSVTSKTVTEEWHLEVVAAADGDTKGPKPLNSGTGEDTTIRIIDHSGTDAATGPVPTPAEISKLFDAVQDAFADRDEDELNAKATDLAKALKADLYAAMQSNDEKALTLALQRARDVDLPSRAKATEMLCKLQIANATAKGDGNALKMALRFAVQNGLESLPECLAAKGDVSRLKKEQLKKNATAILDQEKPDLEAVINVLEMAQRRGWDDVAKRCVDTLVSGAGKKMDDGDLKRLTKVHQIASERKMAVVLEHTTNAFAAVLAKAAEDKDVKLLISFYNNVKKAGLDEFADGAGDDSLTAMSALKELCDHWKTCWTTGDAESKKRAQAELQAMEQVAKTCKAVKDMAHASYEECRKFDDSERQRVDAVIADPTSDIEALLKAYETAKQCGWNDTQRKVLEEWNMRLDNGRRDVAALMGMHNGASKFGFDDLCCLVPPVILQCIDASSKAKDAVGLLEMISTLNNHGGKEFAAKALDALKNLVNKFKSSDSIEAQGALEKLHIAAKKIEETDDVLGKEIVDMVVAAVGDYGSREKEREKKLANLLEKSNVLSEMFDVLFISTTKGWHEIADLAKKKINTRVGTVLDEGMKGIDEVAQLWGAAKKRSDQEMMKVAGSALAEYVQHAKRKQDASALLKVAVATEKQKWVEISSDARTSINQILSKWKKARCERIPDDVKDFEAFARSVKDSNTATVANSLLTLADRCREAINTRSYVKLADIAKEAKDLGFTGIVKDVEVNLEDAVKKCKLEKDTEGLRALSEASKRCGLKKMSDKVYDLVSLSDRMKVATAHDRNDVVEVMTIAREAAEMDWTDLAREGRAFCEARIKELKRQVKTKEGRAALLELHKQAREAGLDDIADDAVEAVGGELPSNWTVHSEGGKKDFMLKKVAAHDHELMERMQEMVDKTFMGWGSLGPDCVTRDRPKTKNPLATRLKVEEVIHVENTENYLCYQARRDEIARIIEKLKPGEMDADYHGKQPADWDIKTRQVSFKGLKNHLEEPCDKNLNEVWLWHGTSEAGVNGITDSDFDMGRAGSATGSMFGRGLYFAESVLKADEYARAGRADGKGWSPLLLSRVCLGRVNYCDAKKPWDLQTQLEDSVSKEKGGKFHAVLGDREVCRGTFREFIVFDNDQVYPEYIVWYSRVDPMKVTYP